MNTLIWNIFLTFGASLWQLPLVKAAMIQYDVSLPEKYLVPCDGADKNNYITKYFDISDLKMEYNADNDKTYVNGKIVAIRDLPDFDFRVEVYKKKQGDYVQTPFTIYRKNFCAAMKSPGELWSDASKKLFTTNPCPLKKGNVITLENIKVNMDTEAPKGTEGEYRSVVKFQTLTDKMCMYNLYEMAIKD